MAQVQSYSAHTVRCMWFRPVCSFESGTCVLGPLALGIESCTKWRARCGHGRKREYNGFVAVLRIVYRSYRLPRENREMCVQGTGRFLIGVSS